MVKEVKMKNLIKWLFFMVLIGRLSLTVAEAEDIPLIKSVYISISVRTPKQEDIELIDYETKSGVESIYGSLDIKSERENGVMYEGIHLKTAKTKIEGKKIYDILSGISAEIEVDTSRDIHEQWLYYDLLDIFDVAFIRMSGKWDRWEWQGVWMGMQGSMLIYNIVSLKISYDTDCINQQIFKSEISAKHKINKIYIKPLLIFQERNCKKFVQGKIEIGYEW